MTLSTIAAAVFPLKNLRRIDLDSFEDVNLRPLNSVIKLQLQKNCGLPDGNYSRIELVNNDDTESII